MRLVSNLRRGAIMSGTGSFGYSTAPMYEPTPVTVGADEPNVLEALFSPCQDKLLETRLQRLARHAHAEQASRRELQQKLAVLRENFNQMADSRQLSDLTARVSQMRERLAQIEAALAEQPASRRIIDGGTKKDVENNTGIEEPTLGARLHEMQKSLDLIMVIVNKSGQSTVDARASDPSDSRDYYTTKEFAKRVGRAPYTVRKWIDDGVVDPLPKKYPNAPWRIPKTELARCIANHVTQKVD